MSSSDNELVDQLGHIEETLRDRAFDVLREASETGDPALLAEEKRLTKARRAIVKAIAILETP